MTTAKILFFMMTLGPTFWALAIWWANRKVLGELRRENTDLKVRLQDSFDTMSRYYRIDQVHEKNISEIVHGVDDDRASELLSSGPTGQ